MNLQKLLAGVEAFEQLIQENGEKRSSFLAKLNKKYAADPLEDFTIDTRSPAQVEADVRKNFPYLFPAKDQAQPAAKAPMQMQGRLPTDLLGLMQTRLPDYNGKVSLHLAPNSTLITAHYNLNAFGPHQANMVKAELDNALRGSKYQLNPDVVGVKPDVDELDVAGYAFNW